MKIKVGIHKPPSAQRPSTSIYDNNYIIFDVA